jgi:hypothetical protein
MLTFATSCSDVDFSEKYPNPAETTAVSCEKIMTGVFLKGCDYTLKGYLGVFGWESYGVSRFAQTLGFINSTGRYETGEAYYAHRWNNFYNLLPQFRLLEKTYNELPDAVKPDYRVFMLLSKIYMLDHLSQVCDAWGDVPYSKAGYLPITGEVADARPAYDTAESICETMLNDLKTINDELSVMSVSHLTVGYLTAHDFFNKGDLLLWRKYGNSLRLRIALRVSSNGSLTAKAQQTISEMLQDPAHYPMIDNNDEATQALPDDDGFAAYATSPRQAYETWSGEFNRASAAMVNALQGDPRIEVIFDKNGNGEYQGVETDTPYAEQYSLFYENRNYYSAFDSATFSRNNRIPGVTVTAAEVSFAKAEAYQRGLAAGDAKAAFIEGILQSTAFYFRLNHASAYRPAVTQPGDAAVRAFAEEKWNAATDKLEAIGIQRWLNYGVLQPAQAWAEIRRTGFPALTFADDAAAQTVRQPPNRFRYPKSEVDLNTENYNAVRPKDNWTTKMFWAK